MPGHDATDRNLPSNQLPTTEPIVRATVYLQSLAPTSSYSSQERLVERLQSLVDAGYIDELTVTVWGEQVCTEGALSTVTDCSQIIQAIGDFFALAADSSVEVAPFFRVKEISSSLSGEEFNCISTPARCVAFYTAESLLGVYPCKVDGVVYTPEDALTQLERLTDEEHQQARA
ncbi:HTH domain-containing protein [Haloarcula pelagica]|uniref:HTH domain-containing protein n=1 Tax=Haloarcula pelagica TaxID=3033389 RepID=UPI0024C3C8C3|nr:HTH domain-containing protein [Halomicroarcula sp. YJ-61-S]